MSSCEAAREDFTAYESNEAYLRDQLHRLDLLIRRQWNRVRSTRSNDQDPAFRGLVVTEQEVDALLTSAGREAGGGDQVLTGELTALERAIAARVTHSWQAGHAPALEYLAALFGLNPFERDVVVVLLAPEMHGKYERLYGYLQDDVSRRHPTGELILNLLCDSFEEALAGRSFLRPESTLIRRALVAADPDRSAGALLSRSLRLEDRIVDFIVYRSSEAAELEGIVESRTMVSSVAAFAGRAAILDTMRGIARHWRSALFGSKDRPPAGPSPLQCWISGPAGSGKREAAAAIAGEIGMPLISVDAARMRADSRGPERIALLLQREAVLTGSALFFRNADAGASEPGRNGARPATDLPRALAAHYGPVFFGVEKEPSGGAGPGAVSMRLRLPRPDSTERQSAWKSCLDEAGLRVGRREIEDLAAQFRFTRGQIREAVGRALVTATVEPKPGGTAVLLRRACRESCSENLGGMARKIEPAFGWDDLVLPPDRLRQLRELCMHVRLRDHVLERWGFGGGSPRGTGTHALFAGPPGTGKTLAAEIIAGELGMNLHRIDLAGVVSKYIGETEKNLCRLFQAAESGNAILFFDEADALFGKRTEVKDSHDRYANIEINYLLQRIEEYDGVAILATNQRGHMDEAFARRLRFFVDFPFPDADQRGRIWEVTLPRTAPLDKGINLRFLATRFKLAGGNIRNAAMSAAFLAAAEKGAIRMEHLVLGVVREFRKLGRICTKSEFGRFYRLVSSEG